LWVILFSAYCLAICYLPSAIGWRRFAEEAGIENYWHSRFAAKRKEGEWFALTAQDVRAFKRWKRVY